MDRPAQVSGSGDGINPYVEIDMKLGTYDIVVDNVRLATLQELLAVKPDLQETDETTADNGTEDTLAEELKNWYAVEGNYFTECSFVFINGSEYETYFVDENTLLVDIGELQSLSVITVSQKSNSTILTTSEPFTYFEVDDISNEPAVE